jgi:hypothetical protein
MAKDDFVWVVEDGAGVRRDYCDYQKYLNAPCMGGLPGGPRPHWGRDGRCTTKDCLDVRQGKPCRVYKADVVER